MRELVAADGRLAIDLTIAGVSTHVIADLGDQRVVLELALVGLDVGDRVEPERGQLRVGVVAATQASFETIERAMQITEHRLARSRLAARSGLGRQPTRGRLDRRAPGCRLEARAPGGRLGLVDRRAAAGRSALASTREAPTRGSCGLVLAPRHASVVPERVGQVARGDRLFQEVIGPDVEHVGELAQVAAQPTVEQHRDARARPSPAQAREQHVGIDVADAGHDRRGRVAGPHPPVEFTRLTQRHRVAKRLDLVGEAAATLRVTDDQDFRRHGDGV